MTSAPNSTEICVELKGITKRFGAVVANEDVSLDVRSGEIHAIVGENGAGKSTLMSILHGMQLPDTGHILIDGKERIFHSARDAIALGIGMVHQHFMLAPSLTSAENIVLGYEPGTSLKSNTRDATALVRELFNRFDLQVPPDTPVRELAIGAQQRVEILKALHRGARILILDEPTAVLSPEEVETLFSRLRNLRSSGITIIFISHKLREVMALSDRVTVMRRGKTVETLTTSQTDQNQLADLMVGSSVSSDGKPRPVPASHVRESMLRLQSVQSPTRPGNSGLKDLDLDIRRGEIVGIAAIEGNGQSDLMEIAAGVASPSAGQVFFKGNDVTRLHVGQRRALGLAYVPEDRHRDAIALDSTAAETFLSTRRPKNWIDWFRPAMSAADKARIADLMQDFDVRPADPDVLCRSMSGGNQQKLVFARELADNADCILLGQPTRGIDIGASRALFERIWRSRDKGAGVLFLSADLDELFSVADRIVVMFDGRIVSELDPQSAVPRDASGFMTGAAHAVL